MSAGPWPMGSMATMMEQTPPPQLLISSHSDAHPPRLQVPRQARWVRTNAQCPADVGGDACRWRPPQREHMLQDATLRHCCLNGVRRRGDLAWYHSRETPPASMPSSPWNCTDSLARISSAVLQHQHTRHVSSAGIVAWARGQPAHVTGSAEMLATGEQGRTLRI